jgi:TPP-dependent pyruvate/acetoin dehydrogenase alpha subunit
VRRCHGGEGPILLEAETYRWHGHYEGDAQPYKPADESAAWKERDPLILARRRILEQRAVTEHQLDASDSDARDRVDEAVERARAAPAPQLEEAYAHVFSD